MADLAFVPKGLVKLIGREAKRWAEGHFDHLYIYPGGVKTEITGSGGGTSSTVDVRSFSLLSGVAPARWYYPTSKTVTSAIVNPSSTTSGTMTIYIYAQVVGSANITTVATLSIPAVAAKVPTTIDFTDTAFLANSEIWAECADLKGGGTVSVSVVMQ